VAPAARRRASVRIAGTVWMAIAARRREALGRGRSTDAVAVLGLIMAGLVAVMVWLAQQATSAAGWR